MVSSIVSFAKRDVVENLPGMQNAYYFIAASVGDIPNILHVPDSHYHQPDLNGQNQLIFVPSAQIAESVVRMHISSQLAFRVDRHPAIFAIPDEAATVQVVKTKYQQEMMLALAKQREWFKSLVEMADDDWQLLHKRNMISEIQRTAARELGLKREWLDVIENEMDGVKKPDCPFCGSNLLNPTAPICPTCGRVHNPGRLAELEASFVNKQQIPKVN